MTDHSELDEIDLDQFDDFDSRGLESDDDFEDDDFLDRMWSGYGFRGGGQQSSKDLVVAHGMVQSFVNAFSRDGKYVVRFDPTAKTAGTDMGSRIVVITPAPALDPNISAQEAGLILTGLAVHEISHPRYGQSTFDAVRVAFPRSRFAKTLSNLLDDVRIERRFIQDYPGYARVFDPLIKYIAGKPTAKLTDQLNLAIAAVRFSQYTDWSGDPRLPGERDWWQRWAETYAREDSPRRHVDGIREALRHVLAVNAVLKAEEEVRRAQPEQEVENSEGGDARDDAADDQSGPEDDQDGPGGDEARESVNDAGGDDEPAQDDPGDDDHEALPDEYEPAGDEDRPEPEEDRHDSLFDDPDGMPDDGISSELDDDLFGDLAEESGVSKGVLSDDDEEPAPVLDQILGKRADDVDDEAGDDRDLDTCPSSGAVEQAAREDGVLNGDIMQAKEEADEIVRDAMELQEGVDVATHYRGLTKGDGWSRKVRRNGPASRFIRDALMRARTGHTSVSRFQKRGRVDNSGLDRVLRQDFRVFERKHAPGPEKLLIWLLIDCSGSMSETVADAATVATAIADAAQHVRTTRMAVWGWSDTFRRNDGTAAVCRVWQTGQPTSDIAYVADLKQGGTPDDEVMNWAYKAILKEVRNGERPVIIFASDGQGYGALAQKVAEARMKGVEVYSVAIGQGVRPEQQLTTYGENNYVEWQGSIIKTARPLAKLVARMVSGRRQ